MPADDVPIEFFRVLSGRGAHTLSQGAIADQLSQSLYHLLESAHLEAGLAIDDGRGFVISEHNARQTGSRRFQRDFGDPFQTGRQTLSGYETMNMIRKGQAKGADKGDILAQVRLIDSLFGVAA